MLDGRRIIVVEDNPIVALDLEFILSGAGAEVIGPFHAIPTMCESRPDAAILDVELDGCTVFPFAERLRARGVPIVFHTGYWDTDAIRHRFPHAFLRRKPSLPEDLLDALEAVMAAGGPIRHHA